MNEVVEALGFGAAQCRTLAFGVFAAYFTSSAAISLSSLSAIPVSESFDASTDSGAALGRALPTTLILVGFLVGNVVCGYLTDTLGRRPTLLYGLGLVTAAGASSATAGSLEWLLWSRFLTGCGAGLSLGPALVLMSETTPEAWRIWMQGVRGIAFELGRISVALLCVAQDPMLLELNWRHLTVFVAGIALAFTVLAWMFVAESPVFLASIGQHSAAREGFDAMQKHNGVSVNIAYAPPTGAAERHERTLLLNEQLAIIFSPQLMCITCAAMLASLAANVLTYGDLYAVSQTHASAAAMHSAWQFILQRFGAIFWNVLCIPISTALPRRIAVVASLIVGAFGSMGFAWSGSVATPRSPQLEMCFQLSISGIAFSTVLSFIAINQLAVEIYPRTAAGMGFAVILGVGRIGAVGAPLLFEMLLPLHVFACHYTMAGLCLFSAVVVWQTPDMAPYRVGVASEDQRLGHGEKDYGAAICETC